MTRCLRRTHKSRTGGRLRSTRGFSLVELMITLVLSLIVIEGVMQVYQSNRAAYVWVNAHARQQESLRFALDTLILKMQNAAYQGCSGEEGNLRNVLNSSTDYDYDFSNRLFGYTGTGSSWLPSGLPSAITDVADPNSDVMTFRGISEDGAPVHPPYMNNTAAALHVVNTGSIDVGDVVMATDCRNSSVFQVTNITQSVSAPTLAVIHNTGGSVSPGNSTKDLGSIYGSGSELVRVVTTTFYVSGPWDHDSDASTPLRYRCWGTDTIANAPETPGLCRVEMGDPGYRIIDGIERLKVVYGQDTDNDASGAVDRYVAASQVSTGSSWNDVVSVKIGLLFRTDDEIRLNTGPTSYTLANNSVTVASDRYMRRAITQTVAIRNHLP